MALTAVVTNHNYARYLPRCIASALEHCDEVLVYDDGSTDESLTVLAAFGDRIRTTHRRSASGDPVWGSNLGIEQAAGEHLVFLDADNYLTRRPPTEDLDYLFAAIEVVRDDGSHWKHWRSRDWPLDATACWRRLCDNHARGLRPLMPFPWGGVWRVGFLRDNGLAWRTFDDTAYAADLRTAIDWCKARPTLGYSDAPFLAFRRHGGQMSGESPERAVMLAELGRVIAAESGGW